MNRRRFFAVAAAVLAAPSAVAESLSVRAKPSSAVKFMDLQDRVKIYLNAINKDIAWCLRNTSGKEPTNADMR